MCFCPGPLFWCLFLPTPVARPPAAASLRQEGRKPKANCHKPHQRLCRYFHDGPHGGIFVRCSPPLKDDSTSLAAPRSKRACAMTHQVELALFLEAKLGLSK